MPICGVICRSEQKNVCHLLGVSTWGATERDFRKKSKAKKHIQMMQRCAPDFSQITRSVTVSRFGFCLQNSNIRINIGLDYACLTSNWVNLNKLCGHYFLTYIVTYSSTLTYTNSTCEFKCIGKIQFTIVLIKYR